MEAVNTYRPTSRFREAEWLHSVKSVTRTIWDFLPSLRTRRSGGFEKIFSHRFVVCDWSGIHNITLRRYWTLLVLNWAMAARTDDPHREADTLLVWDEVHQYASTDIQNQIDIAEPFVAVVLRQSCKRGFCVLALDQHPAKTMLVVRGARTKIVMELSEGRDINTMVMDMNLSPEQRDYLAVLPPRQAIVKTLLIPEPFLVEIPEVTFG